MDGASTGDILLWVGFPYTCFLIFILGHWWRYKYDKFGWTTRSSQLYESRLLRWGSPLFHFGLLFAIGGHVIGLLIPKTWTDDVGISEAFYHLLAVTTGTAAGIAVFAGLAILIYRRRTVGPVFSATTPMDKVMYAFLTVVILLGLANTVGQVLTEYNYREGVSLWFRGLLTFNPDPTLMAQAPFTFQAHALVACALFALWPFTRLVHVFSAPVEYMWRPYIVYRSRDARPLGSRNTKRGWEKAELEHSARRR